MRTNLLISKGALKVSLLKFIAPVALLFGLSGCASLLSNEIPVGQNKPSSTPLAAYPVSIRVAGYEDKRVAMLPKKIGITNQRVSGVLGTELLLDQDVAEFVGKSMQQRFHDAGYQMVADANASALFELRGVVQELTYNVLSQDEVFISLETTLTEVATGQVVWSGIVKERPASRYAGTSGNSKADIAKYLKKELGIVTKKTAEAISATLMASRPALFNLTPGTQAISGVTMLHAASGVSAASGVAVNVSNGKLILSTQPVRAKVYLNGVYFGLSPLNAEIEAGVHQIKVSLEGYKSVEEKVSVRKGANTELELILEK